MSTKNFLLHVLFNHNMQLHAHTNDADSRSLKIFSNYSKAGVPVMENVMKVKIELCKMSKISRCESDDFSYKSRKFSNRNQFKFRASQTFINNGKLQVNDRSGRAQPQHDVVQSGDGTKTNNCGLLAGIR